MNVDKGEAGDARSYLGQHEHTRPHESDPMSVPYEQRNWNEAGR
jgi:hypothetical protein